MNRRSFLASLPVFSRLRWHRLDPEEPEPTYYNVVRYPYIQNVQGDRATIMWATFEAGFGVVEYSSDGVNFKSVIARRSTFFPAQTYLTYPFTQYEAQITGLNPATTYVYRTTVDGQPMNLSGDGRFQTAGGGPFSFLVLGDSGQATPEQFNIASRMTAERGRSFVLHTGDVAYFSGTYGQFQTTYFDYYQSMMASLPVFAAPGNHDCDHFDGRAYLSLHSFPKESVPAADYNRYYSFDWGNAHITVLDAVVALRQAIAGGGTMLRWLENDLRSTRQFWKIVVVHYPPYATGPNAAFTEPFLVRTRVVPILEANGVQLVFSGDEHSFHRSRPIRNGRVVSENKGSVYYATGGGGAAPTYWVNTSDPFIAAAASEHHYLRVEVDGTKIRIGAIRQNGTELDGYVLQPHPIITADETSPEAVTFFPAPGAAATLLRISGHSLAAAEATACEYPAPTEMGGTTVSINGQPIRLFYVSPDQIFGELPLGIAAGSVNVRVTTGNGFSEAPALVR